MKGNQMGIRHYKRFCFLFVLTVALFQMPRLVFANHDEDGGQDGSEGIGLLFDISGCSAAL